MAKKKTAESNLRASKGTPSTMKYLEIAQIRNDTIIMKDGSLRALILVSSINFFLKSDDEQEAVIQNYRQLLNTFDFPIQIVIQSRKYDIGKYLARLEKIEKTQTNDLLRLQIADYRQFVGELIEIGQIMDKRFFAVVPYDSVSDRRRGFRAQLKELFSAAGDIVLKNEQFFKRKHLLDLRVDSVMSGMLGMGLNAVRVDTQGLVEVFYTMYNPDVSPQEKMAEVGKLQVSDMGAEQVQTAKKE